MTMADLQLELHLVSTTVTQPAIAAIRFQFWRDALKSIWEVWLCDVTAGLTCRTVLHNTLLRYS